MRLAAALVAALTVTGCARQIGGDTYDARRVGRAVETRMGVVENVRIVQVREGDRLQDNTTGGLVGGLGGAAAGSQVGHGTGQAIAIGAGAIAGAALGTVAERGLTDQRAMEYIVRMDDGALMTIVQKDDLGIPRGTRVFVQLGQHGERARIMRPG